jgi:hypothetical protein
MLYVVSMAVACIPGSDGILGVLHTDAVRHRLIKFYFILDMGIGGWVRRCRVTKNITILVSKLRLYESSTLSTPPNI